MLTFFSTKNSILEHSHHKPLSAKYFQKSEYPFEKWTFIFVLFFEPKTLYRQEKLGV
jgi:hypothetical protein